MLSTRISPEELVNREAELHFIVDSLMSPAELVFKLICWAVILYPLMSPAEDVVSDTVFPLLLKEFLIWISPELLVTKEVTSGALIITLTVQLP